MFSFSFHITQPNPISIIASSRIVSTESNDVDGPTSFQDCTAIQAGSRIRYLAKFNSLHVASLQAHRQAAASLSLDGLLTDVMEEHWNFLLAFSKVYPPLLYFVCIGGRSNLYALSTEIDQSVYSIGMGFSTELLFIAVVQ